MLAIHKSISISIILMCLQPFDECTLLLTINKLLNSNMQRPTNIKYLQSYTNKIKASLTIHNYEVMNTILNIIYRSHYKYFIESEIMFFLIMNSIFECIFFYIVLIAAVNKTPIKLLFFTLSPFFSLSPFFPS